MKKFILLVVACVLLSFGINSHLKEVTPFDHIRVSAINACLIDAVSLSNSMMAHNTLQDAGVWSKVVAFKVTTKEDKVYGHAVCFFLYKGKYFLYDPAYGSYTMIGVNLKDTPAIDVLKAVMAIDTKKIEISFEI
jgi:hypothetical protein